MRTGSSIPLAATFLLGLAQSIVAAGLDWPRWRGPDCNGISKETGWSTTWPSQGPRQLWKTQIGIGFSSFAVAGNRVYTMGHRDGQDMVWCLDMETGREIWKHPYAAELDARLYEGGPNSTPTLDGGSLFTLGRHGQLFCLDASNGHVTWKTDLMKDHGLKEPGQDWWGLSGSPLVEGDLVLLNAGTHGMAFNKKTGKVAWTTGKGANGYASPVPFEAGGQRGVAVLSAKSLGAVNANTGQELWELPWKTSYDINAADPIFANGYVFVSSGYRTGGALFKLDGARFTEVWRSQEMHNQLNPSLLLDGHLYGISGQNGYSGDLRCVEFMTGKVKWKEPSLGMGSVMAADGKLIALSERGELIIAEAKPDAFKALARAQVLGGRCWTVPVLSHGRIFCRNAKGDCVCLDVRGDKSAQATGALWRVEGGVLIGSAERGSWLMSEREYGDFEIEFDFKLGPMGNSGCALRAPMAGDPAFDGMELQMADYRYNTNAKPSELTGGIYRAIAPTKQVYRPTEWNHYQITLRGPHLAAVLNGEKIQDIDLSAQSPEVKRHDGTSAVPVKDRPRRGHIGFQNLSRGNDPVLIRNARLRVLD